MKKTFFYLLTTTLFLSQTSLQASEFANEEEKAAAAAPVVLDFKTLKKLSSQAARKKDEAAVETLLTPIHNGQYYGPLPDLIDWFLFNETRADALLGSDEGFQLLFLQSFNGVAPVHGRMLDRLNILKQTVQPLVEREDPVALNLLGFMHEQGLGVAKSVDLAQACFEKSAAGGNKHGAFNCGRLLAKTKDAAAERYFETAIGLGHIDAGTALEEFRKKKNPRARFGQ